MTIEEARIHVGEMTKVLSGILTVISPVLPEDAITIIRKLEERGYSLVPTAIIVRNNEASLELQKLQDKINQQNNTIIQGQAARIAQLEAQMGIEKQEVMSQDSLVMWISNRESA